MEKQQALAKQPASQKNISIWKPQDKANIAMVIGRVFDLQKAYGKTAGQMETMIDGFCWALKDYDPERVIWGFGQYILSKPDMPTPFDIRNIIDPVKKPWEPDKNYYQTLKEIFKREGPYGLDTEEAEYMRAYEDYMKKQFKMGA